MHAALGLAEGSASEEWVRLRDACVCCSCGCSIDAPLRCKDAQTPCEPTSARLFACDELPTHPIADEHGLGEPIRLMPSNFQLPEAELNAQLPDPVRPSVQHARASAIAMRAEVWVTSNLRTLTSGPSKAPLRALLLALTIVLMCGCLITVLVKVCTTLFTARSARPKVRR